jgi:peptide-methionine (S)-S-oxide reductase
VFQVDYDPTVVSFARLLDVFWSMHDPCRAAWSTQYAAILFYHDDEQRRDAEQSVRAVEARTQRPVQTELRKLDRFYLAEDYHQKYALRRNRKLVTDLLAIFPDEAALVESTAAARINAHLDGHLSLADLRAELERLGLRAVGEERLTGVERAPEPAERAVPTPTQGSEPVRR